MASIYSQGDRPLPDSNAAKEGRHHRAQAVQDPFAATGHDKRQAQGWGLKETA
ncbi:hypothetical protein PMIT1313_00947 [Prochlorococcus marinus str. MIT 1313]|uniref:hypothetical protein n=1 Tax=Prochlorococcus TaxID=1218 RepID=UPI0007C144D0|nr:hypothetical protein [Prochlorococcus marinus]KZR69840.1 hypothetical protein PMIT1313_00947 [Prochlorococcus marinus str. MIT 1313]